MVSPSNVFGRGLGYNKGFVGVRYHTVLVVAAIGTNCLFAIRRGGNVVARVLGGRFLFSQYLGNDLVISVSRVNSCVFRKWGVFQLCDLVGYHDWQDAFFRLSHHGNYNQVVNERFQRLYSLQRMFLGSLPRDVVFQVTITPFSGQDIVVMTNELKARSSTNVNAIRVPRVYSTIRRVRASECTVSRRPVRLFNEALMNGEEVAFPPFVGPDQVRLHRGMQATQVVFVRSFGCVFTRRTIRDERYANGVSNFRLPATITDGRQGVRSNFLGRVASDDGMFFINHVQAMFIFRLCRSGVATIISDRENRLLTGFLSVSFTVERRAQILATVDRILFFRRPQEVASRVPFHARM